jgi:hypothetical protein
MKIGWCVDLVEKNSLCNLKNAAKYPVTIYYMLLLLFIINLKIGSINTFKIKIYWKER